ncbi:HemK2/MTQ2 family protein methyltransferase [Streptomyces sp. NPDC047097]|uniref:HemK2/MTQ2 family protein methyltransferase n=1 Tax=Streptomyces sp. NPDC047097 TaxID=3155260 RepID=UPI0033CACA7B
MAVPATDPYPPVGRTLVLPGVYAPQHDTRLLAAALRRHGVGQGHELLDIGTGSGAVALYAAALGARVTAVDIARRAVLTARLNALLTGRPLTVRRCDPTAPGARLPTRYDVVVSNPPYVPAPAAHPPRSGAARAWDAGWDGRAVVDRICAAAPRLLRPTGLLLMVHSALCGTDRTLDLLHRSGMRAAVDDRAAIPFGPVLGSRLPWLRARGLLSEGAEREELVVIRAVPQDFGLHV